MAELVYVDASAFLDRALGQKQHEAIAALMLEHARAGGRLVSSRLLHLEIRRIAIRERGAGRTTGDLEGLVDAVVALPLTEEVWARAHAIEHHVRTLDSLHLATCQLVGATLLSTDDSMVRIASLLGIEVARLRAS